MSDHTRTLVVVAHPDPNSLTHHVASELARSLTRWGTVDIADLHQEGFDPRFNSDDRHNYQDAEVGTPADVVVEQLRIDRATDLVLVFPIYWWSMPAMLKGWVDRVFINGWAFDYDPSNGLQPKLGRLTIHLVPVAASDAGLYERHGYEKAMRTQIEHGLIEYCGSRVGSSSFLYDSEDVSNKVRSVEVGRSIRTVNASFASRLEAGSDLGAEPGA